MTVGVDGKIDRVLLVLLIVISIVAVVVVFPWGLIIVMDESTTATITEAIIVLDDLRFYSKCHCSIHCRIIIIMVVCIVFMTTR